MGSREALVALNLLPDIGPVRVQNLLSRFESAAAVLSASKGDLMLVDEVGVKAADNIVRWRELVDVVAELERIKKFGAHIITSEDDAYPSLFREIYDPPLVLYVRGELKSEDAHSVAMVGTRQSTLYGRQTAERLARQLAASGVTVVSGGARGIDSAAHEGALQSDGRTIAVLGTGLDIVYPAENIQLYQRIAEKGRGYHAVSLRAKRRQAELSNPQPHCSWHDAGYGGCGSQSGQRRAHHRQLCRGVWANGVRRARPHRFTAQRRLP